MSKETGVKKKKIEEKKTKTNGQKKEQKKYIYIGDDFTSEGASIVKNTIVSDLKPFEEDFKKDKELESLFVEMKEFSKIKHRLSDPNYKLNRVIKKRGEK